MRKHSNYDTTLAEEICERLATGNDGLAEVLAQIKKSGRKVPSLRAIHYWREDIPEFGERYRRAREMQAELHLDEAYRVAKTPEIGEIVTVDAKKGTTIKTVDNVERSKLVVLTLIKRAAIFNPAFADRQNVDLNATGELAAAIAAARKRIGKK